MKHSRSKHSQSPTLYTSTYHDDTSFNDAPSPKTATHLKLPLAQLMAQKPEMVISLQRTIGNHAVRSLLHPLIGLNKVNHGVVQRFKLEKIGGASPNLDPSTFSLRSNAKDWKPNTTNRGWIQIFFPNVVGKSWNDKQGSVGVVSSMEEVSRDASGIMMKFHTVSAYDVEHAEEACMKIVTSLGFESRTPIGTPSEIYIHSLYTERAPCKIEDNMMGNSRFKRNVGSCQMMLSHLLDKDVVVYYSVANTNSAHTKLMMQSHFNDLRTEAIITINKEFAKKLRMVSALRDKLVGKKVELDEIQNTLIDNRDILGEAVRNVPIPASGEEFGAQKMLVDAKVTEAKIYMPPKLIQLSGLNTGTKTGVGFTKPVSSIHK